MIEESIEYHVVMKSVVLQPLSEGLSFTFIGFHCANTKDIYNLNMEKKFNGASTQPIYRPSKVDAESKKVLESVSVCVLCKV